MDDLHPLDMDPRNNEISSEDMAIWQHFYLNSDPCFVSSASKTREKLCGSWVEEVPYCNNFP